MFCKKDALKNLAKLTENPCARVYVLIKLQLKKRLWPRCFPVNIAEFLVTLFYRTPPVAASGKIRAKCLKLAKFRFQLFLTRLDIMGSVFIVT